MIIYTTDDNKGAYSIDDNELTKIDTKKLISFLKKAKKNLITLLFQIMVMALLIKRFPI